jgi:hypothetical protein
MYKLEMDRLWLLPSSRLQKGPLVGNADYLLLFVKICVTSALFVNAVWFLATTLNHVCRVNVQLFLPLFMKRYD